MNQTVSISPLLISLGLGFKAQFVGPVIDPSKYKENEQQSKDRVHSKESEQREQYVAGRDHRRGPVLGSKKAVTEPRLPPYLRDHPPGGIRDKWQREAEHQQPQQPV